MPSSDTQFKKGHSLGHKPYGGFSTRFKKGHRDLVPKEKRGHTQATRNKISKTLQNKKNIGEKNWNYKGGITKIDRLCRGMKEYKQWRSDVFQRDSWVCRTCGITGVYVTAHHICGFVKILREESIKDILDARKCSRLWDINNGITLCEECHKLTDNYKGRGMRHLTKI